MDFGSRLRLLWRLRLAVGVCLVLAVLAAVWSVAKISLSPPGLTSRALGMATASTQVVIDTPQTALLDKRRDTYTLQSLKNRAVLLGNVMASQAVRESIARRAKVPVAVLQVTPPLTPEQPRALAETGSEKKPADILKFNDQYRLDIQANPTVPILRIFAEAPDARTAELLANAAVDAMRSYLADLARSTSTPELEQIRLVQLGRASGEVINGGIDKQVAILAFLLTFAASCATAIFLHRIHEGWRLAALLEQGAPGR